MRCRPLLAVCLLCFLAHGCSRERELDVGWLERGKHLLFGVASEEVPSGIYMPDEEWDEQAEEVRFDEERFPDWARGWYSACVYWRGEYSRREINQNRSPGEPTQWELVGTAWGWALVGDEALHILQLTIRDKGNEITVVDAWDAPDEGP
jgi:hypothetical protein